MKKISIVVPVYNVEKYIEECVDSLLNQNYQDFEVIFVDDGSKDNSVDKIRSKIEGNADFRIVTKENGGLSSARNFGLTFAQGEFVTFLDSDDFLDKNYLSMMLEAIGDANICCCGYREITDSGQFIRDVGNNFDKSTDSNIYANVVESINFIPNAWGKIYRRDIFNKLQYPEGMLFEDFAIVYKVFYQEKVKFIDYPLYFYRIRNGSIMRDFNENIIDHKFVILKQLYEFLTANQVTEIYREAYINSYLYHGLFVTSCVIINQRATDTLKCITKVTTFADEKIFTLSNIVKSKSLGNKIKLYLLLLKISPRLALLLKSTQNKIGNRNGAS